MSLKVAEGVLTTPYEDSADPGVNRGVPWRLMAKGSAEGVHRPAAPLVSFTERYLVGLDNLTRKRKISKPIQQFERSNLWQRHKSSRMKAALKVLLKMV